MRYGRKQRLEWERQHREAVAAQRGHAKENAEGFLQIFTTGTLVAAAAGEIDLRGLAIDQLAGRGLDPSTGEWIGFPAARKAADELKQQHGM